MEIVTNHWDGYANNRNNFFVYHDPTTDKLDFIPWGPDGALQQQLDVRRARLDDGTGRDRRERDPRVSPVRPSGDPPAALRSPARAPREHWNESALHAEIDRMEALITPIANAAQGTTWHADVTGVREFVTGRRAKLTAALDAGTDVDRSIANVSVPRHRCARHRHVHYDVGHDRPR